MSTTIDHGAALTTLLRKLKGRYKVEAPATLEPLEQFVYSYLLWDAPTNKADAAMKRVQAHVVDFNDLRVCRPGELSGVLGKQYPKVEERVMRMRASLNDVFKREFQVSLDSLAGLSKRDAKRYLETLEGIPPFVTARVMLLALQSHAVPVDERLLTRLIEAGVLEPDFDTAKAEGILERHIKAEHAIEAHALFTAWCDDAAAAPVKPARGGAKAAGSEGAAPRRAPRTSAAKRSAKA